MITFDFSITACFNDFDLHFLNGSKDITDRVLVIPFPSSDREIREIAS